MSQETEPAKKGSERRSSGRAKGEQSAHLPMDLEKEKRFPRVSFLF